MMGHTKLTKYDFRNLISIFVLSVVGMLLFSCHTSPLFPDCLGYDSAIFSLLGKSIVEGKTLYTDLFDHKGPFVFFINALGHLLGGRNGIFLIQCFSVLITVSFLYFTGKLLMPEKKPFSTLKWVALYVGFWAVFFCSFQGGNLTEEYSLPFISASCYLFIRYLYSENPAHPPIYAFFYGIALAFISLLRLNNAVTICAGILFIALILLYKKQYLNLLWNILSGICGLLIVFVPVLLYFYNNNSLSDMIYATFIHNFKIALNTGTRQGVYFPYIPIAVSFVLMLWKICKTRKIDIIDGLLGFIFVLNFLSLCVANRFLHYFTVFTPVYFIFLIRYAGIKANKLLLLAVALCTGLNMYIAVQSSAASFREVYIDGNERINTVTEDMSKIPINERDSVIGFEISPADYLAGNIIPCYKYFANQNTWSLTTPSVLPDFMNWVNKNEPLWLLAGADHIDQLKPILDSKYEYMFENTYMTFYRLKQ